MFYPHIILTELDPSVGISLLGDFVLLIKLLPYLVKHISLPMRELLNNNLHLALHPYYLAATRKEINKAAAQQHKGIPTEKVLAKNGHPKQGVSTDHRQTEKHKKIFKKFLSEVLDTDLKVGVE